MDEVANDGGASRAASVRRTHEALVAAAAAEFVTQGVHAPIRAIASRAGVGIGTVYRHFPNRADLVVAVYRHQIDGCVTLAEELQDGSVPAGAALVRWIDAFADFVVTKHGLGTALQSDDPSMVGLHELMLERLVPACRSLIEAGVASGEVSDGVSAYTLMRAVGNLCIVGSGYDRTDAMEMVHRLLAGCTTSP